MSEFNAISFSPDDWGGHSPGDVCRPIPLTAESSFGWIHLGKEIIYEIRFGRRVKTLLKNPPEQPFHTLREGDTFIALDVPARTIINFQEQKYTIMDNGDQEAVTSNFWGITIPARRGGIAEIRGYIKGEPFGHGFPPELEIGRVTHTRLVSPIASGNYFRKITSAAIYSPLQR